MSQQWFIVRPDGEDGPHTSSQLKSLADSGFLTPQMRVRKATQPKSISAGNLKGLFADEVTADPSPMVPPGLSCPLPKPIVTLSNDAATPIRDSALPDTEESVSRAELPASHTEASNPQSGRIVSDRFRITEIRQSLIQKLLSGEPDLPECPSVKATCDELNRLRTDVVNLDNRLDRLEAARVRFERLERDCDQAKKDFETTRGKLVEFHKLLGTLLYGEFLLGNLAEHSAFEARSQLQKRITALVKDRYVLASQPEAGLIQNAKVKSRLWAISAQLMLEKSRINDAERQIGKHLIDSEQEDSGRCERSERLIGEIQQLRKEIQVAAVKRDEAKQNLIQQRLTTADELNLKKFRDAAQFNDRIRETSAQRSQAQRLFDQYVAGMPDRLKADDQLTVGSIGDEVSELRRLESVAAPPPKLTTLSDTLTKATSIAHIPKSLRITGVALIACPLLYVGLTLVGSMIRDQTIVSTDVEKSYTKELEKTEVEMDGSQAGSKETPRSSPTPTGTLNELVGASPVIGENDQNTTAPPSIEIAETSVDRTLPPSIRPQVNVKESAAASLPDAVDVSDMVRELKDADARVRRSAAIGLSHGLKFRNAIPDLIELLKDDESGPRSGAAQALASMGPVAAKAIPVIIDLYGQGKLDSHETSTALSQIGGLHAMLSMLDHQNAEVRATGLRWIEELSPVKKAEQRKTIQRISALIEDQDYYVCFNALLVLRKHGPAAESVLPKLIEFLKGSNEIRDRRNSNGTKYDMRAEAMFVVAAIGPSAKPAVPTLLTILKEQQLEPSLREHVIYTLGRIGHGAADAVPQLVEIFPTASRDLKEAIMETLGKIGPAAEPAVGMIAKYAEDLPGANRLPALNVLSHIGKGSREGIPFLIQMMQSRAERLRGDFYGTGLFVQIGSTVDIRADAAWTLVQIGEPSIPHLVKLLKSEDLMVSHLAAISLARIGASSFDPLIEALTTGEATSRISGLFALQQLASVQPGLFQNQLELTRELLGDEDYRVRVAALRLVDCLGMKAIELSGVIDALQHDEESKEVRDLASDVALRITNKVAQGELWRSLTKHESEVKRLAVSPDGTILAAMSGGAIRLWRVVTGVVYCEISSTLLCDVAFSPDGYSVAGVTALGDTYIWRAIDGLLLRSFKADGAGRHMAYSPCGSMLAVTASCPPGIWDIKSKERLAKFTGERLDRIRYSEDGGRIFGKAYDQLGVLDVKTCTTSNSIKLVDLVDFDILPNQSSVITVSKHRLGIWDSMSEELSRQVELPAATTVTCSPKNELVAVGLENGKILIFKSSDLSKVLTIDAGTESISGLAFVSGGRFLASITDHRSNYSVNIWKIGTEL